MITSSDAINVVFDVDETLTCYEVPDVKGVYFFQQKGAILHAPCTQYVFPGVPELITLLSRIENIRISFFSSGGKDRIEKFVDELLKYSLAEKYEELRSGIQVLSRPHVTEECIENPVHYFLFQKKLCDSFKKDISKVLRENDLCENVILIDDRPFNIMCSQIGNLLYVPPTDKENFIILPSKRGLYQSDGYKFLKCLFFWREQEKTVTEKRDRIAIVPGEEGFKICFFDYSDNYVEKIISSEHERILMALKTIYSSTNIQNSPFYTIEHEGIRKDIYTLIESFNGKIKKICRQANRIYYATGLLFTALHISWQEKIPVSQVLLRLQFEEKDVDGEHKLIYKNVHKVDSFYFLGLEKLREINRHLQFTTPHSYAECIDQLPTDELQLSILEKALDNELDDCCIM